MPFAYESLRFLGILVVLQDIYWRGTKDTIDLEQGPEVRLPVIGFGPSRRVGRVSDWDCHDSHGRFVASTDGVAEGVIFMETGNPDRP